ncbi:NRDE family protein [Tenacibaculum sp. MEBiC06402]|uniref:NRDE family protein n=1 Tax=unclassified Tenacibaculum TaxID=2635139 RepID=UPI003B9D227D
MCTVTYLPLEGDNFIFTSNRDENPKRNTIEPKEYLEDNVKLVYPKDELAGGTWIGLSERERLVCLLNGGYEIHEREVSYRLSRGVIVKQILKSENAVAFIEDLELNGVEPFTVVMVDWKNDLMAYELVWTGERKDFRKLDNQPYIWSSSTLYTQEMKSLRKDWFSKWLSKNRNFEQSDVLNFHLDESNGEEISLKMKRAFVETVSVTSIKKQNESLELQYYDLLNNQTTLLAYQNKANDSKPTNVTPIVAKNI